MTHEGKGAWLRNYDESRGRQVKLKKAQSHTPRHPPRPDPQLARFFAGPEFQFDDVSPLKY